MSVAKLSRSSKRQLGQFLTPRHIAEQMVSGMDLTRESRVLEPGFGDGSFVIPLVRRFVNMYEGSVAERIEAVLTRNVFGVELDDVVREECFQRLRREFGVIPAKTNLIEGDFLGEASWPAPPAHGQFTHIIGNPPFGGSLNPAREDAYERAYGMRGGQKIKKETYSFFIVKCLDLLAPEGSLDLLCSDTWLSINTMRGLRDWLLSFGHVEVSQLDQFSDETSQAIVFLGLRRASVPSLRVFGNPIDVDLVTRTPNHSWLVTGAQAKFFGGPTLKDFIVATGGMTTGRNEYFVRPIVNGQIAEPYTFEFGQEAASLDREIGHARLGQVPAGRRAAILARAALGETDRVLIVRQRQRLETIGIPHPDYRYYNKAVSIPVYAPPTHVIYWKDDGDAVLTFKRTGNWYLRGVGGAKYFGREGLTWSLVSSRLRPRYLPPGYVLDSGAPAAFLRPGVAQDELYFVLGWLLTRTANNLLKGVINHTRNIQGKDVERLPYPYWVDEATKSEAVALVQDMIERSRLGHQYGESDVEMHGLEAKFEWRAKSTQAAIQNQEVATPLSLWGLAS